MIKILQDLLKKRGIQDPKEMSPEERGVFDNWQRILSEDELTVDKIRQYLVSQIAVIEGKWQDLDKENSKKAELIPYFTVYKLLLNAIDSPKSTREALEQQLNNLIQ